MEVRTRVLRDQLGVKLAKEANVNFDAPQTVVAVESPPERNQGERPRGERGPRENRGPKRTMQGRPDRGARAGEDRFKGDAAPRRAPPAPSTPERRRKHVSALRAEIAADAATTRKRIERSATHDRKGRTIAVERISRTGEDAGSRAEPETRPKREAPSNKGERGGRTFKSSDRADRGDSFWPKRGRAAGGRERPSHSDHREPGRRPERSAATRSDGGPRERRFDRPAAKGDGDRRDGPPRTQGPGRPTRQRKFNGPEGRTRPPAGEGRPRGSGDKSRGSRSDFKPRLSRAGARDGDRPQGLGRGPRSDSRAPREREFDRPEGRTRPAAGDGRPPRSEYKSRGSRSDFKSRPPRAGARDGDRPQGPGRGVRNEGGTPRGRSLPGQRPPPRKGPPKGAGGSRRPPRKS
jgi:23S rRNA pseudouridine2605 synthase